MTLRDELAAVLGPGNDDATAYAQADAALGVLAEVRGDLLAFEVGQAVRGAASGPHPPPWLRTVNGIRPHAWKTADERADARRLAEAAKPDFDHLRAEGLLP